VCLLGTLRTAVKTSRPKETMKKLLQKLFGKARQPALAAWPSVLPPKSFECRCKGSSRRF
jgi:hypothetical protein